MAIFRSKHISPNTIGMIPVGGYINRTNFSMDSIRWLKYVEHCEKISIKHALNGQGEIKIGNYFVDGFCESSNTVYEFHVSKFLV